MLNLHKITTDGPQMFIFGRLLFIIYLNDNVHSNNLFTCICYADDTTLTSKLNILDGSVIQSQSNNVNNELTKISNWLKVNKRSINDRKIKFMTFHMPQTKTEIPLLKINREINIIFGNNNE